MLEIKIGGKEYYDEQTERFITDPSIVLKLEHSLISVSAWEAKWKKPFLKKRESHTYEETIDYIRFMTLNKNVNPGVYDRLTMAHIQTIESYIDDKMTATWFPKQQGQGRSSNEIITAESIYYWMIANSIPFECEKWHLNRLLTLIHVCEIKQAPAKKMSKKDIYAQNRALNAKRKHARR